MKLKKLTSVTLTIFLSVILSGCMFSTALGNVTDAKPQYHNITHTMMSDTLIAIGKPSQKIQGYEDSLVLAGNKYSYFIEPNSDDKQLFSKIFSQVDLKSVYINNQNINAEISSSCKNKHGCGNVEILFQKEKSKFNVDEEKKIKEMGFNCYKNMMDGINYSNCYNNVSVGFTVISQVENFDSLQHTFKKPVNLKITRDDKVAVYSRGGKIKKGIYDKLLPVAVVVDIITFPIQFPFFLHEVGNSKVW